MPAYTDYFAHSSSRDENSAYNFVNMPPQIVDPNYQSSRSANYPYTDYSQGNSYCDNYLSSQDTSYTSVDYLSQGSTLSSVYPSSMSMAQTGALLPDLHYGDYPASVAQSRFPFRNVNKYDTYETEVWDSFADVFEHAGNPIPLQRPPSAPRATTPSPPFYTAPPPRALPSRGYTDATYITPRPSQLPTRGPSPPAFTAPPPRVRPAREHTAATYITPTPSHLPAREPSPSAFTAPPPRTMPARGYSATTYITPPPSHLPTREPSPVYITPASSSSSQLPREPSPEPVARCTRSSKGKGKRQLVDDYSDEDDDEYRPGPERRTKRARTQRETHAPYHIEERTQETRKKPAAGKGKRPKQKGGTKKSSNSYLTALHDVRPVLSNRASYGLAHGDLIKTFAPFWYRMGPAEKAPYVAHAGNCAAAAEAGLPKPALPTAKSATARLRGGKSGWEVLDPTRVLAGVRHVVRASVAERFDEHVTPTRAQHHRGTEVSPSNALHFAMVYHDLHSRWAEWCDEEGKPKPPKLPELFTLDDVEGGTHEEAGLIMAIMTRNVPDAYTTPVRW